MLLRPYLKLEDPKSTFQPYNRTATEMLENPRISKQAVRWLISPGVLKTIIYVGLGALAIFFLTKLKNEQIALANRKLPALPWAHGTDDRRLQAAIEDDDPRR